VAQHADLIVYSLCFGLSAAASFTRQMALLSPRPKFGPAFWSSLYSGFTALSASIWMAEELRLAAALVVASSIACGLLGETAYSVLRTNFLTFLRQSIMTPGPKGKDNGPDAPAPGAGPDRGG
jgi:hypothetical protein